MHGRPIAEAGQVSFFREKPSSLAVASDTQWEKVTLTVDSGASDTVVPPSVCPGAELLKTSRVGTEYEIADGGTIENLGEKWCLTRFGPSSEGAPMLMNFQVVDVSKALLSVHKVTEQGHDVLGDRKQRLELRHVDGTYELDVWVKPSPHFGGRR